MIDDYALALSYVELSESGAFRHLMQFLHSEVTASEGKVIIATAAASDAEARNLFIAWQERKKIVIGIEYEIERFKNIKQQREEELENERSVEHARANRTGW